MKILIKIMDKFQDKINSLWTFEMMTLCLSHTKNEKKWSQKICHSNIKIKLKNSPP
jgi:hypothetical protein